METQGTVPWPELLEEARWLTAEMEERIQKSRRTPVELEGRARELRAQAAATDIKGIRDASLALASRYEAAAAARLQTR